MCERVKIIAEDGISKAKTSKVKISFKHSLASALNNLGYYSDHLGQITQALNYYDKSYKIYQQLGDKQGSATALNNIGIIYHHQNDYTNALKAYKESLKMREEIGTKYEIASSLSNIAVIYGVRGEYEKFHKYSNRSLAFKEEIGDDRGVALSLNNMAIQYEKQGEIDKALEIYYKALKITQEFGFKSIEATCLNNIGETEFTKGNTKIAKGYANQSYLLAKEIGYPGTILSAARLLSMIYEKEGDGMKALELHKLAVRMKDSLDNDAVNKATVRIQAKYEYEKIQAIKDKEHEKQLALEQEAKAKQRLVTYAIAGGLGLVGIFLLFVMNRLKVTRKQKSVIEHQKEIVEEAHKEIQDSIVYAKRIQLAILPPTKLVKEYLKESFILYKPKDVVAGDFYWMEHKSGKVLFAAADCTGHGVPGAMVSVVCNNGLNRSVREYGLTDPGQILDKTREIVIQEFEKSEEDVKDGMDIALCCLDGMKLQYAGAHNPLWIIRDGEIIETKADKQPIGQFDNPEPYKTHSFDLKSGDLIYIFSDGYVDQFGGEKGKKFKSRAFRDLLLSIQDKSMEEQKEIIDEAFEAWKGALEQIDDVCVIGVKI